MSELRAATGLRGVPFTKMTGSGNDFVVFDGREVDAHLLAKPEVIRSICNRHNGIGADGIVILEPLSHAVQHEISGSHQPVPAEAISLRYYNSDGTLGEMCGNATLCSTNLAVSLGLATAEHVELHTDSGVVRSRMTSDSPEIDLAPVTEVRMLLPELSLAKDELRAGFARVGVPHIVILTDELDQVDVQRRGQPIRQDRTISHDGANVNWLQRDDQGGWRYRTYERGVEGETLACGTGAVACAILLSAWGLAGSPVQLGTRSGREVTVTLSRGGHSASESSVPLGAAATEATPQGSAWLATLAGEGRIVFRGSIAALA